MSAITPLALGNRTESRTVSNDQPIVHGQDETIVYGITTTTWGTPTAPAAKIYRTTGGSHVDVTETCMTGAASALGDVITTPTIHSLTGDNTYRVEVTFTCEPSTFEFYFDLQAEE